MCAPSARWGSAHQCARVVRERVRGEDEVGTCACIRVRRALVGVGRTDLHTPRPDCAPARVFSSKRNWMRATRGFLSGVITSPPLYVGGPHSAGDAPYASDVLHPTSPSSIPHLNIHPHLDLVVCGPNPHPRETPPKPYSPWTGGATRRVPHESHVCVCATPPAPKMRTVFATRPKMSAWTGAPLVVLWLRLWNWTGLEGRTPHIALHEGGGCVSMIISGRRHASTRGRERGKCWSARESALVHTRTRQGVNVFPACKSSARSVC
jgi:hypothetical protein